MANTTASHLVVVLRENQLLDDARLSEAAVLAAKAPDHRALAKEIVQKGWLTVYQMNQVLQNKTAGLNLGPYVLLDRLGEGGMGAVFKARHRVMNRIVALKVIRKEKVANPDSVRRFQREIQAAAQLHHPNIVIAHDAAHSGDTHFLVMEYVEGNDLYKRVQTLGPLPVAAACEYMRQAAQGLEHAREMGMVHRDIKPHNLLVTPKGVVKILDMGLARLGTAAEVPAGGVAPVSGGTTAGMTQEGAVMGTPEYMAPEQALDASTADIRADIYSLGCTFFYLLTGRPPFLCNSATDALVKHQLEEPEPVEKVRPEVPKRVGDVMRKMMAKNVTERFQTPGEVAEVLGAMVKRSAAAQQAPPGPPRQPRTASALSDSLMNLGDTTEAELPRLTGLANAAVLKQASKEAGRGLWSIVRVLGVLGGKGLVLLWRQIRKLPMKVQLGIGGAATLTLLISAFVLVLGKSNSTSVINGTSQHSGAAPYRVVKPGNPISPRALVSRPAIIDRLQSWTIETRDHRTNVTSHAFSLDGSFLATGDKNGTIRIWDPDGTYMSQVFLGHPSAICKLAWSANGKMLASASPDAPVRIWEVASGRTLQVLKNHPGPVPTLTWGANDTRLASASQNSVWVWNVATGQLLQSLDHPTGVSDAAWSPTDKRQLATACGDKTIRIWNPDNAQVVRSNQDHAGGVAFLAWSPDGKYLATGAADNTVRLWDVKSNRSSREVAKDTFRPARVAFSPDGNTLAYGAGDGLRLWDIGSNRVRQDLGGNGHGVHGIAWAANSKTVISMDSFNVLHWYDAVTGQKTRDWVGSMRGFMTVAWSRDGKYLAASWDQEIRLWAADALQQPRRLLGHSQGVTYLAFAPDGKMLASASLDQTARLWDTTTGKPVHTLAGHAARVDHVAWSPKEPRLATYALDRTVRIWSAGTGKPVHTLDGHAVDQRGSTAWSADGSKLATLDRTKLRIWDTQGGKPVQEFAVGGAYRMAWSHDGASFATAGQWGSPNLLDAKTGKELRGFQTLYYGFEATDLAWASDGKSLLGSRNDTTAVLWDPATGKVITGFRSHTAPVEQVAWLHDGKTVLSSSTDGTVHFWEALTGRQVSAVLHLLNDGLLLVGVNGFYAGSPQVERLLVYVVQTEQGQETLTPNAFEKKYGWKNDPSRVRLTED